MPDPIVIEANAIYFVSDTHFQFLEEDSEERIRRGAFITFLESLPEKSALVLLGDIFDFYFEYASVVQMAYFDIYHALYNLKRNGIQIYFLGGNHDSWSGRFLSDTIGVVLCGDELTFTAQARTVVCAHGDMALPGDRGYKLLKAIIRNRAVIAIARLIHPDLLAAIARFTSNSSKKMKKRSKQKLAASLVESAFDTYFSEGNDIFIMGHVHEPVHRTLNGKDYIILGDWIEHFAYAVLRDGQISQGVFREKKKD